MNQADSNLLAECMKEAMKVEFLDTSEEIKLWAGERTQSKRASPEPPDRRPSLIHSTNILFTFK